MATTAVDQRIPSFSLYGEAPRDYDERMLHVETIAFRSSQYDWKIEPHFHRSLHQLLLVTRGRGTVLAEGRATTYRPPVLIVMPAGAVHGFEFERGTLGYVMSIADGLPREIARREPNVEAMFDDPATLELRASALRETDLERSFDMLAREFSHTAPGRWLALEGLLSVLLANVLRLPRVRVDSGDGAVRQRRTLVARFRVFVERHFRDGLSVAEYAEALNVSESRLRSACLGVADQSPMQMIHARILLEAKRELLYTTRAVSEIAYALGFDDPAYFTRFFSRRTGAAPRTFRSRGRRK